LSINSGSDDAAADASVVGALPGEVTTSGGKASTSFFV
jgi:hypothetical protein